MGAVRVGGVRGVLCVFGSFRAADAYAQYATHIAALQTAAVIVFTSLWCVCLYSAYYIICTVCVGGRDLGSMR